MKTIKDLFELIAKETEMNEDKRLEYLFDINTRYQWLSMYVNYNCEGHEIETIFSNLKIETPEEIQLAYWSIYNNGRSKNS